MSVLEFIFRKAGEVFNFTKNRLSPLVPLRIWKIFTTEISCIPAASNFYIYLLATSISSYLICCTPTGTIVSQILSAGNYQRFLFLWAAYLSLSPLIRNIHNHLFNCFPVFCSKYCKYSKSEHWHEIFQVIIYFCLPFISVWFYAAL